MKNINLDDYESIFDAVYDARFTKLKPSLLSAFDFPLGVSYFRVQDLREITQSLEENECREIFVSKYSKEFNRILKIKRLNNIITYSLENINCDDIDVKELYSFTLDMLPESYLEMYITILWEVKSYKNN